jgi:hypothetical protein
MRWRPDIGVTGCEHSVDYHATEAKVPIRGSSGPRRQGPSSPSVPYASSGTTNVALPTPTSCSDVTVRRPASQEKQEPSTLHGRYPRVRSARFVTEATISMPSPSDLPRADNTCGVNSNAACCGRATPIPSQQSRHIDVRQVTRWPYANFTATPDSITCNPSITSWKKGSTNVANEFPYLSIWTCRLTQMTPVTRCTACPLNV